MVDRGGRDCPPRKAQARCLDIIPPRREASPAEIGGDVQRRLGGEAGRGSPKGNREWRSTLSLPQLISDGTARRAGSTAEKVRGRVGAMEAGSEEVCRRGGGRDGLRWAGDVAHSIAMQMSIGRSGGMCELLVVW